VIQSEPWRARTSDQLVKSGERVKGSRTSSDKNTHFLKEFATKRYVIVRQSYLMRVRKHLGCLTKPLFLYRVVMNRA